MSNKSPLIKREPIVIEAAANGFTVRGLIEPGQCVPTTNRILVFNDLGRPGVYEAVPSLLGFVAEHFKPIPNEQEGTE